MISEERQTEHFNREGCKCLGCAIITPEETVQGTDVYSVRCPDRKLSLTDSPVEQSPLPGREEA